MIRPIVLAAAIFSLARFREAFSQAPLLFLCILLFPCSWLLLDWMDPSVKHLISFLRAAGGSG